MARLRSKRLVAASVAIVVVLGGAGAVLAGGFSRSTGPDRTYGAPNAFAEATAAVHVVPIRQGSSYITLHVRGVEAPAGTTFGAHVHQSPCGPIATDAGPHYQHAGLDPTLPLELREVWLDVTVNAAGNGHSAATRTWQVDESTPRSVIVHALPTAADGTAGPRLACIDLDGAG